MIYIYCEKDSMVVYGYYFDHGNAGKSLPLIRKHFKGQLFKRSLASV